MANRRAREVHDFVRDASVQHELAGKNKERNRKERKDIHPGNHLLKTYSERHAFVEQRAQGGEPNRERNGYAEQ